MKRLLLLLFCLCLFSGCWDRREINELAFVSSAAFDKEGDSWHVTVEFFGVGGAQGGTVSPAQGRQGWLAEATGESLFTAIRNLAKVVPRRVYWSHCQGIILGEALAREGLADFMDFWDRYPEVRGSVLLFVSHGKARDLVNESVGSLDDTLGLQLAGLAGVANLASANLVTNVRDFLVDLANKGIDPILCGIKLVPTKTVPGSFSGKEGDVKGAAGVKVQLDGQALFRQSKMVGWLPQNQVRGLLWVLKPPKNAVIDVKVPGTEQRVSLEVLKVNSDIQLKTKEKDKSLLITVQGEFALASQSSSLDLNSPEKVRSLERQCDTVIRNEIKEAIETARKLQADPFAFGHHIYMQDIMYWHHLEADWPRKLPPISYDIEMKFVASGIKTRGPVIEGS